VAGRVWRGGRVIEKEKMEERDIEIKNERKREGEREREEYVMKS
jgi:hypothetical protein